MMPHPVPPARHVFVYGTLRAGGSNDIARYVPSPLRVGYGEIKGALHDLGAYPGVVLGGEARVRGEVYRITPAVESALDALEGVEEDGTGEYRKREVDVWVDGKRLACLVYEINPDRVRDAPVIACGDWLLRS